MAIDKAPEITRVGDSGALAGSLAMHSEVYGERKGASPPVEPARAAGAATRPLPDSLEFTPILPIKPSERPASQMMASGDPLREAVGAALLEYGGTPTPEAIKIMGPEFMKIYFDLQKRRQG
jgi:hypothetical protein